MSTEHCAMRLQQEQQQIAPESVKKTAAVPAVQAFHSLGASDAPLIEILSNFSASAKEPKHLEKVAEAISRCSYAAKSHAKMIGTLTWLIAKQKSAALTSKFVMYLKTLYDKNIVNEESVRAWYNSTFEQLLVDVPSNERDGSGTSVVSSADVAVLKKAADIFIQWLDKQNEEEDDDEEEDEEDN